MNSENVGKVPTEFVSVFIIHDKLKGEWFLNCFFKKIKNKKILFSQNDKNKKELLKKLYFHYCLVYE